MAEEKWQRTFTFQFLWWFKVVPSGNDCKVESFTSEQIVCSTPPKEDKTVYPGNRFVSSQQFCNLATGLYPDNSCVSWQQFWYFELLYNEPLIFCIPIQCKKKLGFNWVLCIKSNRVHYAFRIVLPFPVRFQWSFVSHAQCCILTSLLRNVH